MKHIRILEEWRDIKGYLHIKLTKDGTGKRYATHRLVAEAFCPNPENLPCVNHCNERRDDNKAFNLDWVSVKENNNYGEHGKRCAAVHCKKVLCIETGVIYESLREAERLTGFSHGNISQCCNGKSKTCGGYLWEFIEVN